MQNPQTMRTLNMHRVLLAGFTCLVLSHWLHAQNVGVGTTNPDPSALLELSDTIRGLLIPRLTTQQRNAIPNPAHALMIFNVDSFCLEVYDTATQQWYAISCPKNCLKFIPVCTPTIWGPTFVCAGDTVTYTATGCTGVNLQWTVPGGWTILSGQGSTTLQVIPDTTDGILSVIPCNQCGCGTAYQMSVIADTCRMLCLTIGGAGYDFSYSIIPTADGGYALAGGTNSFGQGNYDVYVVKIDAYGNIQWTRTIGGGGSEVAYDIVQTPDFGYLIVGETYSFGQGWNDVYVIKLDANGNLQWTKTIGGVSRDFARSVILTSDGGYAIAGATASFGQGSYDVYVIKLDANGNVQWTKTIGGGFPDYGWAIVQASDGGYVIAGYSWSFAAGNYDVYVVKLSPYGNLLWTRSIGGADDDRGLAIIQTNDGGYAIAGLTRSVGQGSSDVYLVKLDAMGSLQWTRTIGGTNDESARALLQTPSGNYVLVGHTWSFGQGGQDVYIATLNSTGNLLWTKTIGGASDDYGFSIVRAADNDLVIAGYTNSFGQGYNDFYILKLNPNGNFISCPGGCQTAAGGTTSSGAYTTSGGLTDSGGILSSGGTTSSGGTLTNICP